MRNETHTSGGELLAAPPRRRNDLIFWIGVAITCVVVFAGARMAFDVAGAADSPAVPNQEVNPEGLTSDQVRQFQAWVGDYPADEVDLINANAAKDGSVNTDATLVSILEYRRACRTLAGAADGDTKAAEALPDQLERLATRAVPGDGGAAMFTRAADMYSAGDRSGLIDFLNTNCDLVVGTR